MQSEDSLAPDESQESLLGQVADEFFGALDRGETPSLSAYAERYPELAAEIRNVFPALMLVGRSTSKSAATMDSKEFGAPKELGDFRIIREIGRGGMGVVYEAEQLSLGRRVALKVLPFAAMLDERQLQRFKNEARAAAALHHAHIVPVHSVGCERGVHFYAMQFIDGQSLASVIAATSHHRQVVSPTTIPSEAFGSGIGVVEPNASRNGSVELLKLATTSRETMDVADLSTMPDFEEREYFRTMARLGIEAAEALEHAHQHGIIHRDVKPANLLLDTTGKLWVTDLGLARIESEVELTRTGDVIGTLNYMSPEQALGQCIVDQRTDIYSLGATLYEIATLRKAFPGSDRKSLVHRIAFEEPPRPRQINRRVPVDLDTIICKAMEKDAVDRYLSAKQLAEDLNRFLALQPIRASRPKILGRVTKWSRRHVGMVWTLLGASLAGIALLILSVGLIARSRSEVTAALRSAERNEQQLSESLYAADMRLATQALKEKDPLRGVQLLNRHLPVAGSKDYRDLEWHFLNSRFTSASSVVVDTGSPIHDFAFNSSESTLAIVGKDSVLHIYSWPSMKRLARIETGQGELNGVAFSDDDATIATVGDNGELRLWEDFDAPTHKLIKAHDGVAFDVVYSNLQKCWITCGDDSVIRFFDDGSGKCINELTGHKNSVTSVALSHDGETLASTSREHAVRVWDLQTRKETHYFESLGCRPTNVVFDYRDEFLLLGAGASLSNQSLIPYSLKEKRATPSWLSANQIEGLALSADRRLVAAAFDGGVILTLVVNPKTLAPIPNAMRMWDAGSGRLHKVAFTQDGLQLLGAGDDGKLRVWSDFIPKGISRWHSPFADVHMVDRVGSQPLVAVASPHVLGIADIRTGKLIETVAERAFCDIDVSSDGKLIAACTETDDVYLWSLVDGRSALRATWKAKTPVRNVRISPDNETLAMWSASADTGVRLLGINSRMERTGFLANGCQRFEWAPDGSYFVAAEHVTDDVIVFDSQTGRERWRANRHRSTVIPLAVSADSRLIASGDDERRIFLWDATTGNQIWGTTLPTIAEQRSFPCVMEFTPSGRTLLVEDSTAYLTSWHVATGRELVKIDDEVGTCRSMTSCCEGRYICLAKNAQLRVIDSTMPLPSSESVSYRNNVHSPTHHSGVADGRRFEVLESRCIEAPLHPLLSLDNPTPAANDRFGYSTAISEDFLCVTTHRDDAVFPDSGTVDVYSAITGHHIRTIQNPTPENSDIFGFSVSASGKHVAVGAYRDDAGASNAGAIHIFDAGTGALVRTITSPSPGVEDYFGVSVAIDGDLIVVGALNDDTDAADTGIAYVFNALTGALVHTLHNPEPGVGDAFGRSVALRGNIAVIGVFSDDAGAVDAGAAYVFNAATGDLLHTLRNPTPDMADEFGNSVAIDGNIIVVGDDETWSNSAGAFLFDVTTGVLLRTIHSPSELAGDRFGGSVSISDGRVIVGAHKSNSPRGGAAYIFDAATGTLVHSISNPTPDASDDFGSSVSIWGNRAVVGAYKDDISANDSGAAHLFSLPSASP